MEYVSLEYIFFVTLTLFVISFVFNLKQRKMIRDREIGESSIVQNTFYDSVTDLPNKNNIEIIISENINVASRRDKSFCILAIKALDYNDLKNESFEKSNKLSCDIANKILSSIRDEDTAARVSDDEFVIVFNEYLEEDNYDIPMNRISKSLSGVNVRYAYITFPSEAKTTSSLLDGVLEKL